MKFSILKFIKRVLRYMARILNKITTQKLRKKTIISFKPNVKNSDYLVIILAGWNKDIWDSTFERFYKFIPKNYDVCVVTTNHENHLLLEKICLNNNWSFLHIKYNSVCIALNKSIELFPKANHIFKIDEDIFITKNCFAKLMKTYKDASKDFKIGVVGPIININAATYRYILEEFDLIKEYTKKFAYPKYDGFDPNIWKNPEVAKFLWGNENSILKIDELNDYFERKNRLKNYRAAITRYSIGFIYFKREYFDKIIGPFPENYYSRDGGIDEEVINNMSTFRCFAVIISTDTVVGHFSYFAQREGMLEFYKTHSNFFKLVTTLQTQF